MNITTDTTPKTTVHPAVLAAAVALLAAVPEAQRVPFWRLVAATLDRLHWYARFARKLAEVAGRPTEATIAPAREGAALVLSALVSESEARGIAPLLDALLVVLLGHAPDVLAAYIEDRATLDRATTACAVWAQVARQTGLEVEQSDAAEVATVEPPATEDPRFALALSVVRALRTVDRAEFLEAFDAYLASMSFAASMMLTHPTDAGKTTASTLAYAAADVLVGAHEEFYATLPNEGDTWESADALAAALLHDTVKGRAMSLDRSNANMVVQDIDAARTIMQRVKIAIDPEQPAVPPLAPRIDPPLRNEKNTSAALLRSVVDGACAFVREFPRDLVFRAALGVLSIPGDNTRAFTPHGVAAFAAIEVRHAPEGRYSEAAVARANALRDALAVNDPDIAELFSATPQETNG